MISQFVAKIRSLFNSPNELRQRATAFGGMVLLTSAAVTGVLVAIRQLGVLEGFELQAYDHFVRLRPDEGADDRLLVVAITEADILDRNEYPIHDRTLAELLETLQEARPRAIGIDILRDVPQGTGRAELIDILQETENAIAACKMSSAKEPGNPAAPGVPEERIGFADLPLDRDVSIRRSILVSTPTPPPTAVANPHLCNYDDPENQIPSLSFLLALLYLEAEGIELGQTEAGDLTLGSVVLKRLGENAGGYHQAGAEDYQMLLNYRSAQQPAEQVTLTDVLEGRVDPARIEDRVVLIGYTAQSANDDFSTPYSAGLSDSRKMSGVSIHAQSLSQLLSAVLDDRPLIWYWPTWGEVLWIFGWSVVGGTLAWSLHRPWLFALSGGAAIAILYGTSYVVFLQAGWIPVVPPAIGLLATAGGVVLIDRFNKSGYGQAFYQGVKGVLKLDVEIDREKKERQVAEIAETDYFQGLQQKAKELRSRDRPPEQSPDTTPTPETPEENADATDETDRACLGGNLPNKAARSRSDYFQQLQQKAKKLRKPKERSEE